MTKSNFETFVEFESATDFKGFEALHNTVLDIADQLLCSDVQTKVGQMYAELRWSMTKSNFETFAEFESATDFKGFEALYNVVLDIDDQLLCSDVQTEVGSWTDVCWTVTIVWDVSTKL